MKRRNAILFFGFLTVAILSYAAWCGRFFYLRPGLSFSSAVPEDARQQVAKWHLQGDYFPAEPFSWRALLGYLQTPWRRSTYPPVMVWLLEDGTGSTVYAKHFYRPMCMLFRKGDAGWSVAEELSAPSIDQMEWRHHMEKARDKAIYEFNRMPNMPERWSTDF